MIGSFRDALNDHRRHAVNRGHVTCVQTIPHAPVVKRTIIPRFERGVPGSIPGRGTPHTCLNSATRYHGRVSPNSLRALPMDQPTAPPAVKQALQGGQTAPGAPPSDGLTEATG